MRGILICLTLGLGALSACAQFPDLDAAISQEGRNAAYPRLLPVGDLTRPSPEDLENTQAVAKSLVARARALRRRARALRGPIVDRSTRREMAAALARHPVADAG